MTTVLYPGAFDPVTMGHVDITTRASRIFDRVVVGVYDTPSKALLFDTRERVDLFTNAVQHLHNVEVVSYQGLTVAFAKARGAHAVVRGLRTGSDFEYEFAMAFMNRMQAPDLEFMYMMTSPAYQFVSSSLIKEVAKLGGNIQGLVADHVAIALRKKLGLP